MAFVKKRLYVYELSKIMALVKVISSLINFFIKKDNFIKLTSYNVEQFFMIFSKKENTFFYYSYNQKKGKLNYVTSTQRSKRTVIGEIEEVSCVKF